MTPNVQVALGATHNTHIHNAIGLPLSECMDDDNSVRSLACTFSLCVYTHMQSEQDREPCVAVFVCRREAHTIIRLDSMKHEKDMWEHERRVRARTGRDQFTLVVCFFGLLSLFCLLIHLVLTLLLHSRCSALCCSFVVLCVCCVLWYYVVCRCFFFFHFF